MKTLALFAAPLLIAAAPAPPGFWAGDGLQLRSQPNEAIVQSGCEWGKTRGPLTLDDTGAFTVKGYFNAPVSRISLGSVAPRDRAALFRGTVSGKTMTITIEAAGKAPKTYRLKRGARLRFPKCIETPASTGRD